MSNLKDSTSDGNLQISSTNNDDDSNECPNTQSENAVVESMNDVKLSSKLKALAMFCKIQNTTNLELSRRLHSMDVNSNNDDDSTSMPLNCGHPSVENCEHDANPAAVGIHEEIVPSREINWRTILNKLEGTISFCYDRKDGTSEEFHEDFFDHRRLEKADTDRRVGKQEDAGNKIVEHSTDINVCGGIVRTFTENDESDLITSEDLIYSPTLEEPMSNHEHVEQPASLMGDSKLEQKIELISNNGKDLALNESTQDTLGNLDSSTVQIQNDATIRSSEGCDHALSDDDDSWNRDFNQETASVEETDQSKPSDAKNLSTCEKLEKEVTCDLAKSNMETTSDELEENIMIGINPRHPKILKMVAKLREVDNMDFIQKLTGNIILLRGKGSCFPETDSKELDAPLHFNVKYKDVESKHQTQLLLLNLITRVRKEFHQIGEHVSDFTPIGPKIQFDKCKLEKLPGSEYRGSNPDSHSQLQTQIISSPSECVLPSAGFPLPPSRLPLSLSRLHLPLPELPQPIGVPPPQLSYDVNYSPSPPAMLPIWLPAWQLMEYPPSLKFPLLPTGAPVYHPPLLMTPLGPQYAMRRADVPVTLNPPWSMETAIPIREDAVLSSRRERLTEMSDLHSVRTGSFTEFTSGLGLPVACKTDLSRKGMPKIDNFSRSSTTDGWTDSFHSWESVRKSGCSSRLAVSFDTQSPASSQFSVSEECLRETQSSSTLSSTFADEYAIRSAEILADSDVRENSASKSIHVNAGELLFKSTPPSSVTDIPTSRIPTSNLLSNFPRNDPETDYFESLIDTAAQTSNDRRPALDVNPCDEDAIPHFVQPKNNFKCYYGSEKANSFPNHQMSEIATPVTAGAEDQLPLDIQFATNKSYIMRKAIRKEETPIRERLRERIAVQKVFDKYFGEFLHSENAAELVVTEQAEAAATKPSGVLLPARSTENLSIDSKHIAGDDKTHQEVGVPLRSRFSRLSSIRRFVLKQNESMSRGFS